jgi:hypothetical protein
MLKPISYFIILFLVNSCACGTPPSKYSPKKSLNRTYDRINKEHEIKKKEIELRFEFEKLSILFFSFCLDGAQAKQDKEMLEEEIKRAKQNPQEITALIANTNELKESFGLLKAAIEQGKKANEAFLLLPDSIQKMLDPIRARIQHSISPLSANFPNVYILDTNFLKGRIEYLYTEAIKKYPLTPHQRDTDPEVYVEKLGLYFADTGLTFTESKLALLEHIKSHPIVTK